jgi:hypothetical protein
MASFGMQVLIVNRRLVFQSARWPACSQSDLTSCSASAHDQAARATNH